MQTQGFMPEQPEMVSYFCLFLLSVNLRQKPGMSGNHHVLGEPENEANADKIKEETEVLMKILEPLKLLPSSPFLIYKPINCLST